MAIGAAVGIRSGVPRGTPAVERDIPDFFARERVAAKPIRNEREEGAGQRRGAESNPKAHPRSFAIASRGDSAGMGRGDTSEPVGGDARVHRTRSGAVGVVAARETSGEVTRKSAAKWLALVSVRGYQIFLGPFFGGGC